MKIFNLARGKGETMRMLYASEFNNASILCCNGQNKKHIIDMAKQYDINIPEPITIYDLIENKTRGKHCNYIVVDDIDCVLNVLLAKYGLNMIGGTITIDK